MMTMLAGTLSSSSSSVAMPSMSRWLVGSSSSSSSGSSVNARASAARFSHRPTSCRATRSGSRSKRCRNSLEARRESPALAIVAVRRFARGEAAALGRQQQQALAHRGQQGQQRLLLDEGDPQAVATLQLAVVELQRSRDDFEQRGLAGAVAADEADALADLHREAGSVEERAVAKGEVGIENCDEGHKPEWILPVGRRCAKPVQCRLAE